MRAWLSDAYPDAVIIPEGVEPQTGSAAFDADFFLVIHAAHAALFNNGGAGRSFFVEPAPCFFDAEGAGSTAIFLDAWKGARTIRPGRPIILASADHDFSRLACGTRDEAQLGAAFTFLLTWGSIPSIYYGDEIGLRYQPGLPDKEGSIIRADYYNRAGARTPMQWDDSANAGFSTAPAEALYLPIDPSAQRPTVAAQRDDPQSVLTLVRRLIALRKAIPALGGSGDPEVLHAGYPFVYRRGDSHLVVVNPRREPASIELPDAAAEPLLASGVEIADGQITAGGFGYGVFELS